MPRLDVDGVIFDLDGVLVDSMPQHARSYQVVLQQSHGIDVAPEEVFRREGNTSTEVARAILADRGIEVADDEAERIGRAKQEAFRKMGIPDLLDGAAEVVRALKDEGLKVGVVTGTDRRNLELLLGPLAKEVDVTVTSDDVTNGKPDPEPYAKGAEALGLDPGRVLVVENAPNGVTSAREAGMHVLGVTSTLSEEELGDVDGVVDDLTEVIEWI